MRCLRRTPGGASASDTYCCSSKYDEFTCNERPGLSSRSRGEPPRMPRSDRTPFENSIPQDHANVHGQRGMRLCHRRQTSNDHAEQGNTCYARAHAGAKCVPTISSRGEAGVVFPLLPQVWRHAEKCNGTRLLAGHLMRRAPISAPPPPHRHTTVELKGVVTRSPASSASSLTLALVPRNHCNARLRPRAERRMCSTEKTSRPGLALGAKHETGSDQDWRRVRCRN
jgi:hypothetical protein